MDIIVVMQILDEKIYNEFFLKYEFAFSEQIYNKQKYQLATSHNNIKPDKCVFESFDKKVQNNKLYWISNKSVDKYWYVTKKDNIIYYICVKDRVMSGSWSAIDKKIYGLYKRGIHMKNAIDITFL